MKTYGWGGLLTFSTRWKWLASFMPWPVYTLEGRAPVSNWIGGWWGPRDGVAAVEILLSLLGIKSRFLERPILGLIPTPTRTLWFIWKDMQHHSREGRVKYFLITWPQIVWHHQQIMRNLYDIFSILLLPYISYAKIFTSVSYSQKYTAYTLHLVWEANLYTCIKPRVILLSYTDYFILLLNHLDYVLELRSSRQSITSIRS
jgi:hypothetical protein